MIRTLIIGGTTGIGEAVTQELTLRSENSGWERDILTPTVHDLDITNGRSIDWFFMNHPDPIHEVVYSAGINRLGMLGELVPTKIHECYDVNVIGFIRLLDKLVEKQGHPKDYAFLNERPPKYSIVGIVSDSAFVPMRGSIAYASSKAALAHAIRCAGRELAPMYRVNGVAPSTVYDTPMTAQIDKQIPALRGWTEEKTLAYEMSLVPMGRRVLKDEVARLVANVLEGPDFLTGETIKISGGK